MAKDPAVLFYTSDFLTGTYTMTNEQVGKYIRLLCLQHQYPVLMESHMVSICGAYDEAIFSKFEREGEGYFNARMREEIEKRKNYTKSRKRNLEGKKDTPHMASHMGNHMEAHMENENENENENRNKDEKNKKVENFSKNALSEKIVEKQAETGVTVRKFVLQTEMKGLFEDYYKSKKGVIYYYDGKSAGNLKQIIQKIRAVSPKEEVSDEQVLTAWKYILLNLNDTWVLDNLDLNIINSKFNTIISKIKNGSTNSNGTHETVGGTAKGFDPRKNTWFARAVENYIQSERENGNLP